MSLVNENTMSIIFKLFVIIISTTLITATSRDLNERECEPIRIELCRGIGYNLTSMPNLVGNELQNEADFMLQTFLPLIQFGCSAQLQFFLCAAYVPMCTQKVPVPIGPCRGLCETVRDRCHPLLHGFGFPWPSALNCTGFPKANNHEHMCMEGPGEHDPPAAEIPLPKVQSQLPCSSLIKSHLYVRLNRTEECAPLCEADILFDTHEKYTAEMWVTAWSVAALFTAFIAIMCLIFSDTKWDQILMPLVTCHTLVAVGWTVRWLAGRIETACGKDPQAPLASILLIDGLSNPPCATNFLLRYYFGMAACVWWATLCLKWHLTVRRAKNETIGDVVPEKHKETHGSLTQVAAWGLPALQTVGVLVAHLVDADELLGTCFVGNQSDKALRILVAMPLFIYWLFGSINLFAGYLALRFKTSKIPYQSTYQSTLKGMGTFLFAYCVPSALLIISVFYEFANRDIWLSVPQPTDEPSMPVKAPMWPYMTKAFMELLLGVLTSAWALGPRISTFWKSKTNPTYKQPPPQKSSFITSSGYSTASYQTVCPHNSLSSSIGKIPRHPRKYPPSHTSRSKTRKIKTPHSYYSHSISLAGGGHETVL